MVDLARMFEAQNALQLALGHDFKTMTMEERISYVKMNVLACISELNEALNEMSWKPWADAEYINETAYFGEIRDAMQFIINLFLVGENSLSPEEVAVDVEDALHTKIEINHKRIRTGYDGVSGKCPDCKRSYDDAATPCLPKHEEHDYICLAPSA